MKLFKNMNTLIHFSIFEKNSHNIFLDYLRENIVTVDLIT